jgi:hypothetical protein
MGTLGFTLRHSFVVRGLIAAAALWAAAAPEIALAARTIVFEDFEDETPGDSARAGQIESIDLYQRSSVMPESDNSDALISGAQIPDPFAPGNKSLILHNPTATTQMAANFYDFFDQDPTQFRNGVIEFDVYMEGAEPDSYWTFFDIRFGFDTDGPRVVSTTGDVTIWNDIRMQEGGLQGSASDILFERRTAETFSDQDVIVPARKMRLRYEINGSPATYTLSIDNLDNPDDPVEIVWPGGATKPWYERFNFDTFMFEPVPGINVISFLTDASANGLQDVTHNVFIDNLRVINNDLPPLAGADFDSDGDTDGTDFVTWQRNNGTATGATPAMGDADGDGAVNGADLAIWKAGFGPAPALGAAAGIPEPAGISSVILAGLFLVHIRPPHSASRGKAA